MPREPGLPPCKSELDDLYRRWNQRVYLPTDPLVLLDSFPAPSEREIAGFLVSCLAVGRVPAIQKASLDLLDRIGRPLDQRIRNTPASLWEDRLAGWVYRFFSSREMAALLGALSSVLHRFTGLEEAFLSVWPDQDRSLPLDFSTLGRFSGLFWNPSLGILVPKPGTTGAFKRLNLFLRWMVRHDEVDQGTWAQIPPGALLVPVDTHVLRWAQESGVCRRRQADSRACLEISAYFRGLAPDDPVRYDFSLTRAGMLGDSNS